MNPRRFLNYVLLISLMGMATACTTIASEQAYESEAPTSAPANPSVHSAPQSFEQVLANQGYIPFHMQQLASGHQTLTVTVNGQSRAFIVDTGAGMSFINEGDLSIFSLGPADIIGAQSGSGVGGAIGIAIYAIRTMSIDEYDFAFPQMSSTNLERILSEIEQSSNIEITGIIGQDFLTRYNAIIDVKNHRVFLRAD